jgi:hypothetical protein
LLAFFSAELSGRGIDCILLVWLGPGVGYVIIDFKYSEVFDELMLRQF